MDTQLVPTQDPFEMMERLDEQQILDEIKGRAIESLVYEIQQGNNTVTGLSLAGVREVVRSMNAAGRSRTGITDREPIVTETDAYFEVKAYGQDTLNGGGYWGIKRQAKTYADGRANVFALEQAVAKAQRNALRGLIPEWFAKEMIDAYRGQGRVKTVSGTRQQQPGNGWHTRTELLQDVSAKIPYYGGQAKHILGTLSILEQGGIIKKETDDATVFDALNEYASKRANEKAVKK